ncbi:MAG: Flp family type IVb pilin [Candidatus Binatia bacterium]
MKILQRLLAEEDGQGLVEYSLIVLFVAIVFWAAVKDTTVGDSLADHWSKITDCASAPMSCSP